MRASPRDGASPRSSSATTLLVAALVSVVTGLVFGTYPALRAARLSPIDAIRHE